MPIDETLNLSLQKWTELMPRTVELHFDALGSEMLKSRLLDPPSQQLVVMCRWPPKNVTLRLTLNRPAPLYARLRPGSAEVSAVFELVQTFAMSQVLSALQQLMPPPFARLQSRWSPSRPNPLMP